jgi:hypothetical protein
MLCGRLPDTPYAFEEIVNRCSTVAAVGDGEVRLAFGGGGAQAGSQAALMRFGLRRLLVTATAMTDDPEYREIGGQAPVFEVLVATSFARILRFLLEALAHGGVLFLQPTEDLAKWYTLRTRDINGEAWGARPAASLAAMTAQEDALREGSVGSGGVAPGLTDVPAALAAILGIAAKLPSGTALPAVLSWPSFEGKARHQRRRTAGAAARSQPRARGPCTAAAREADARCATWRPRTRTRRCWKL